MWSFQSQSIHRGVFFLMVSVGMWVLSSAATPPVQAATLPVGCAVSALINAINTANGTIDADTLELSSGCTYALTGVDQLPEITSDITINGNNATINPFPGNSSWHVTLAGVLHLKYLTISGARNPGPGGAMFNQGTLTIENCAFSGNTATSAFEPNVGAGGAIYTTGTLTVTNSSFTDNLARYGGGSIVNLGGLGVISSTFSNNRAFLGGGGAIRNRSGGTLTVSNNFFSGNNSAGGGAISNDGTVNISDSTFSSNQGNTGGGISNWGTLTMKHSTLANNIAIYDRGGGIENAGTLNLVNSTVSSNQASSNGGGLYASTGSIGLFNTTVYSNSAISGGGIYVLNNISATIYLQNSIVAGNTANTLGQDCYGTVNSQGYNLIQNTADCSFVSATGDLTTVNPLLGPLQNNGGSTSTHALLINSPAINAGNPSGCKDHNGTTLATDQRGFPRPFGGRCDIGSFEYQSLYIHALYSPLILR